MNLKMAINMEKKKWYEPEWGVNNRKRDDVNTCQSRGHCLCYGQFLERSLQGKCTLKKGTKAMATSLQTLQIDSL